MNNVTTLMTQFPDLQIIQFLDGNIGLRTGKGRLLAVEDNKREYFNSNAEYDRAIILEYTDWCYIRKLHPSP